MPPRPVMPPPVLSRLLFSVGLGALFLFSACDATDTDEPVRIRVVHAAPGLGEIDVSIDFDLLTRDLDARDATPYTRWDPGLQLIVVEATVDGQLVQLTREVFLQDGLTYTLVVAGTSGSESLLLLQDDTSAIIPGEARALVVHAAERSDLLDVLVAPADSDTPVLNVLDLAYGEFTDDVAVDAGSYDMLVETPDGSTSASITRNFDAQRRYLIVITNTGSGTALALFIVAEG